MEQRKKRITVLFILVVLTTAAILGVNFYRFQQTQGTVSDQPASMPKISLESPSPSKEHKTIELQGVSYTYDYFTVTDISRLKLYENFTVRKTIDEVAGEKHCQFAINAGFYDTNNTPLGVFVGTNYTRRTHLSSALFNGYIFVLHDTAFIQAALPEGYSLALQSGPILLEHSEYRTLHIQDDEEARRMVAAKTASGDLIFMAIAFPNSSYQGPFLQNLPEVLRSIAHKEHLTLTDGINLDGGSASAFIGPTFQFSELNPVGGVFCLTQ